jgi:nucleoside-diphosphate-sugar epimerase
MSASVETPVCVLTGANGYVGSAVTGYLEAHGWKVLPWTRKGGPVGTDFRLGENLDPNRLQGIHALVHCAYDFTIRRWEDIESVNVRGSEKLFEVARGAGVQSIVFISSISAFEQCRSLYGKAKLQIEAIAKSKGVTVIRPGLVYSTTPGGVFGRLITQVKKSAVLPQIHGGVQTQYLVHADDLGELILGCINGKVPAGTDPITIANEKGWELKQILKSIASSMGKRIILVPVPWRLVWMALKSCEVAGIPTNFRSDSLLGMVYQNPSPSFELLNSLGFTCREFRPESAFQLSNSDLPVKG